jgi:hypothetical protein
MESHSNVYIKGELEMLSDLNSQSSDILSDGPCKIYFKA